MVQIQLLIFYLWSQQNQKISIRIQEINMKKSNYNKSHTLKVKQQIQQSQKEENIFSPKSNSLGGVYLYNQKYERHLAKNSYVESNSNIDKRERKDKISSFNESASVNKENDNIDQQINDFMHRTKCPQFENAGNNTQEIQKIIESFKSSQINTILFLEEIQKSKTNIETINQISFDELFQFYRSQRGKKYSDAIQKIYKQCKHKMNEQIETLKKEQLIKIKKKQESLINFGTQTYDDHYENENVKSIKKQLLEKEAEYAALYDYKVVLFNDWEKIRKNNESTIEDQQKYIKKIESESVSQQYEIKSLQNQLKQVQGRLIKKVVELQRESDVKKKSEISSLNEIDQAYIEDTVNKFVQLKSNLQKRKRYKLRAQSIFSVTQSLLGAYQDEAFASLTDIGPESMKELTNQFAKELQSMDQKERESIQLGRFSHNSMQRSSLFKILQKYLDKKKKRKNNSFEDNNPHKIRGQTPGKTIFSRKKTIRNSSQVNRNIDTESIDKKNQQSHEILLDKHNKEAFRVGKKIQRKSEIIKFNKRFNIEADINNHTNIKKGKKKISFHQIQQNQEEMSNKKCEEDENKIIMHNTQDLASSLEQKSENAQNHSIEQNKLQKIIQRQKKGVSFRLQSTHRQDNLKIISQQISICLQGRKKVDRTHSLIRNSISAERLNQRLIKGLDQHKIGKGKHPNNEIFDNKKHNKISSMLEAKAIQDLEFEQLQNQMNFKQSWGEQKIMEIFDGKKQRPSHREIQSRKQSNWTKKIRDKNQNLYFRQQISKFNQSQYLQKAKVLAAQCKNREEYLIELKKVHKQCGPTCRHIQKYLESFDKFKGSKKQIMKVSVQNLNNNIRQNCTNLFQKNR